MSEFLPPNALDFSVYEIIGHTNELLDISRNNAAAVVDTIDTILDIDYKLAVEQNDTVKLEEIKQRMQWQKYVRLHGSAASRYLSAMATHDNLICCNNDTELGQRVNEFIMLAPSPTSQQFIASSSPKVTSILKQGAAIIYERLSDDSPLRIPITAFVGAIGLDEEWAKGRTVEDKSDHLTGITQSGEATVREYATMPPETAPPVESAAGIVQPDGSIVYISEGAHRTAAAVLRGDDYIQVCRVKLYFTKEMLLV